MATAQDVYREAVSGLSPAERLRLAALILDDLTRQRDPDVWDDIWTDEDQRQVTEYAFRYADARYPEDRDLV